MPRSPHIDLIRPPELSDRAPYAYAAVARDVSLLVFTAGACPLDKDGATVAVGGLREQTDKAMDNLDIALRATGVELSDVVKTTIYVASNDQGELLAAWEVVRTRFGGPRTAQHARRCDRPRLPGPVGRGGSRRHPVTGP
jgi:enamine deaminase RidA (YjgF/YER057c/UK114 family)